MRLTTLLRPSRYYYFDRILAQIAIQEALEKEKAAAAARTAELKRQAEEAEKRLKEAEEKARKEQEEREQYMTRKEALLAAERDVCTCGMGLAADLSS